jgi:hypothetical protein
MRKNATKREIRAGLEWLGLCELTEYAAVSERTLRTWIHLAVDPLPATRVRGKILVNRRGFDAWLRAHPVKPANSLKRTRPTVSATAGQG